MGLMIRIDGTSIGMLVTDWTKRKFQPGQAVKCVSVDNETSGCDPILESRKTYHVASCYTPEECDFFFPGKNYWQTNGGRVVLQEMPDLEFFGRRFEALPQEEKIPPPSQEKAS